jgi:hypothetical protein
MRKYLVIWMFVLAFAAAGQVLSAQASHPPMPEDGDPGEPGSITYCEECNCCQGKLWVCTGRHSAHCGLFGCPSHGYTFCTMV